MKENGAENRTVLNRNWVLKGRRGRLPSGADESHDKGKIDKPVKFPSFNRLKNDLKEDNSSDQSSAKRNGNDGHYYKCVVCELGGKLLCCDTCPRTYHLECLDPALKHISTGKWECPTCIQQQETSCLPVEANNSTTPAKRLKTIKSNVNREYPIILALEAPAPIISKKRKNKEQSHNAEKKCKTTKSKSGSEPSGKHIPKVCVGHSGASNSKGKSKLDAFSTKEAVGEENIDVLKSEMASEETPPDLLGSQNPAKKTVEPCSYEEIATGTQQDAPKILENMMKDIVDMSNNYASKLSCIKGSGTVSSIPQDMNDSQKIKTDDKILTTIDGLVDNLMRNEVFIAEMLNFELFPNELLSGLVGDKLHASEEADLSQDDKTNKVEDVNVVKGT